MARRGERTGGAAPEDVAASFALAECSQTQVAFSTERCFFKFKRSRIRLGPARARCGESLIDLVLRSVPSTGSSARLRDFWNPEKTPFLAHARQVCDKSQ